MRKRTEGVCERVTSERVSGLVRLYLVPGTWYGMGCEGCCETLSESDGFKFPRCGRTWCVECIYHGLVDSFKDGEDQPYCRKCRCRYDSDREDDALAEVQEEAVN